MEVFDLVIMGGGLPGLVGALIAKQRNPHLSVLLIEANQQYGGNLRGIAACGDHFELGTHILQETGEDEIDTLLLSSVSKNHLVALESAVGDFVATVRGGIVRDSVGYPAIRESDESTARKVLAEVLVLLESTRGALPKISDFRGQDLRNSVQSWFGPIALENVVGPILRAKFGALDNLTGFALEIANMSRLQLVTKEEWLKFSSIPGFVDRVAFPSQKTLPSPYQHGRRSLYSSNNGNLDFVEGIAERCREKGIVMLSGVVARSVRPESNVLIYEHTGTINQVGFRSFVSCLGPSATRGLLGEQSTNPISRTPLHLVHMTLRDQIKSAACYFYDQDERSNVFRLTNYGAFSGRKFDTRITIEVLNLTDVTGDELIDYVLSSDSFQAVVGHNNVISQVASNETMGFPMPSSSTFARFFEDDVYFKNERFRDFRVCGVGAGGSKFFQAEVVRDVVATIRDLV